MVNVRRVIGWDSNWASDDDSGGGSESERGKAFARDAMEDGRGSAKVFARDAMEDVRGSSPLE